LNLSDFITLAIVQENNDAMLVAEHRNRPVQALNGLQSLVVPFRVGGARHAGEPVARELALFDNPHTVAGETAPLINEQVVHHAAKPGAGPIDGDQRIEHAEGLQQQFLEQVLGLGFAAGQPPRESIQPVKVRSHQSLKNQLVVRGTHVASECNARSRRYKDAVGSSRSLGQFKYGADVEYQAFDWLGLMLRWDEVNYNLDHGGYVFSAITPRITFSSHFLSGESVYLQYSRYRYGDEMVLGGQWPWGTDMVAGSHITQSGPYIHEKPDMDVVKLQATVAF
jgi:hypothetical protein